MNNFQLFLSFLFTEKHPFFVLVLDGFQVLHHGVSVADLERVRVRVLNEPRFYEQLLNLTVVDDGRVPPGALPETTVGRPRRGHSHAAGEKGSAVGEELHLLETEASDGLVLRGKRAGGGSDGQSNKFSRLIS